MIIFDQYSSKWNGLVYMSYSIRITNGLGELFIDNDEYVFPQLQPVDLCLQFLDPRLHFLDRSHLLLHHAQLYCIILRPLHSIPQQPLNTEPCPNLPLLFQKSYFQILTSFQFEKSKKNLNDNWMNNIWSCQLMK